MWYLAKQAKETGSKSFLFRDGGWDPETIDSSKDSWASFRKGKKDFTTLWPEGTGVAFK